VLKQAASSESGLALRALAGLVLVLVAVGSVLAGLRREAARAGGGDAAAAESPQAAAPTTVYYFHGDTRCPTCRAIEDRTAWVVTRRFADELANGTLAFEIVNFDAAEGRRFRDLYDLAFGSVVVQGAGAGRPWKNLAEVWTLIHGDPTAFEVYLIENVDAMLADTAAPAGTAGTR